MMLAALALVLLALAAPTVLAALAFRRAGAVLDETRRIHIQLANIIQGFQKRALDRRNAALSRPSMPPPSPTESYPPPLPNGPKLILQLEEDWEDDAVETELPGAPTDWGFEPARRPRNGG